MVSFAGNLIGSLILACLAVHSGIIAAPASFIGVASAKTSYTFTQALLRGVLCNWLVTMAVYMAAGAQDAGTASLVRDFDDMQPNGHHLSIHIVSLSASLAVLLSLRREACSDLSANLSICCSWD